MKWYYHFLIMVALSIICIQVTSAATEFYIGNGDSFNLKVSAEIDGSRLSTNGACNISISYPNGTLMVNDAVMTNLNNGYFNYALNNTQTIISGEYESRAECNDAGVNGTTPFIYEVNPTGIRPSGEKSSAITRGVWFTFLIGGLLFVAFLFVKESIPVKWTFFIFSMIFFLISLNVLFVDLQDQVVNPALETFFDGFTAISWIFYWFAAGLLIIMWAFTFINTWLFKKNLQNARRYGLA